MKLTDKQIDAFFGDSPFRVRRKMDKSAYEVVQQTNEDWRTVIDDFTHCCDFATFEEAKTVQRRLHVRWILGETDTTAIN